MPSSKLSNRRKPSLQVKQPQTFSFDAIGTSWSIYIIEESNEPFDRLLIEKIKHRIDQFDQVYSRFRSDSIVTEMSRLTGTYELPDDAAALFIFYKELYDVTEGLLTPLIGQMISDSGYDANYSLKPKGLGSVPDWDTAIDYKTPNLIVKTPVLMDFGAAGKGYLVDIVARLLESEGYSHYSVNAGGDIYNSEAPKSLARIALEHPINLDEAIGIAEIEQGSICCSAGNRRKWAQYNHIIDPSLKKSPNHILSVWVTAKSTMLADGIATALYFANARKLKKNFEFEYALIKSDLSIEKSANFPGTFFN